MTDKKNNAPGRETVQELSERCTRFHIEVVCYFVQHKHARVAHERTGDCEALHLAAGEGLSPQPETRVEPVGQPFHHCVKSALLGSRFDIIVHERRVAQGNVVANRAGDKQAVLEDDSNTAPERAFVEQLYRHSVDAYLALLRLERGSRQLEERRLASTVGSDQGIDSA